MSTVGDWRAIVKSSLPTFVFTALLSVIVAVYIASADFGYHWDEHWHVDAVKNSVTTGVCLPNMFVYPSVVYDIGILSLLPHALGYYASGQPEHGASLPQYLLRVASGRSFVLQWRVTLTVLSFLAALWTYLAVYRWRESTWEAVLAGAFVCLSWEFGYHARFIAVDALEAQFVALSILCTMMFLTGGRADWLRAAGAVSGIAAGTKYPALIAIVPAMLAVSVGPAQGRSAARRLMLAGQAGLYCVLFFVVTTPGALLDLPLFVKHLSWMASVNQSGWRMHTVQAGWTHFVLMLQYLGFAGLSFQPTVALAFAVLALWGVAVVVMREPRLAVVLLSIPVLYVAYFSRMQVMNARNLLLLLPIMAVFAARGLADLMGMVARHSTLRVGLALLVALGLSFNVWWAFETAFSIRNPDPAGYSRQLVAFIAAHPRMHVALSDRLERELSGSKRLGTASVVAEISGPDDAIAFYTSEVQSMLLYTANKYNYAIAWFGSHEINFNYYPAWPNDTGREYIVVMKVRDALPLRLASRRMEQYRRRVGEGVRGGGQTVPGGARGDGSDM